MSGATTKCSARSHFFVKGFGVSTEATEEERKVINQFKWSHWRNYDSFGELVVKNEERIQEIEKLESIKDSHGLTKSQWRRFNDLKDALFYSYNSADMADEFLDLHQIYPLRDAAFRLNYRISKVQDKLTHGMLKPNHPDGNTYVFKVIAGKANNMQIWTKVQHTLIQHGYKMVPLKKDGCHLVYL